MTIAAAPAAPASRRRTLLVCGWLGHRFGVLPVVVATEGLTAATMLAALPLPIEMLLVLRPSLR